MLLIILWRISLLLIVLRWILSLLSLLLIILWRILLVTLLILSLTLISWGNNYLRSRHSALLLRHWNLLMNNWWYLMILDILIYRLDYWNLSYYVLGLEIVLLEWLSIRSDVYVLDVLALLLNCRELLPHYLLLVACILIHVLNILCVLLLWYSVSLIDYLVLLLNEAMICISLLVGIIVFSVSNFLMRRDDTWLSDIDPWMWRLYPALSTIRDYDGWGGWPGMLLSLILCQMITNSMGRMWWKPEEGLNMIILANNLNIIIVSWNSKCLISRLLPIYALLSLQIFSVVAWQWTFLELIVSKRCNQFLFLQFIFLHELYNSN